MSETTVKSAGRVFALLELFAARRAALTLREILAALDWPTSSTSALLKSLLGLGYLTYDKKSRSYVPSLRLPLLTDWLSDAWCGSDRLLRLMGELHAATGETIILGVQSDTQALYVRVLQASLPIRFVVNEGVTRPLSGCGIGWAIMSGMPEGEAEQVLRRNNARAHDPARRLGWTELAATLARTRQLGYAFSRHTVSKDVGTIAVDLPQGPIGRRLALAIGGPVDRLEANEPVFSDLLTRRAAELRAES